MALLYWLPLISDAHNQGLTGTTFTNNNVTFGGTGKLGTSAVFNGSNGAIYADGMNVGNAWTVCCWAKMANAGTYSLFQLGKSANYSNSQFYIHTVSSNTKQIYRICNGNASGAITMSVDYTDWVHYCMTYDGTTCTLYINGSKLTDWSVSAALISGTRLTVGAYYATFTFSNGMIQDFRLYDDAISPREIKEISKGLVLHYPLAMPGQENNIKASTIFNRGCNGFSYSSATNTWTMTAPIGSNTWGHGIVINDTSIKWKSGESWVVSMEVYVPKAISWNHDINNKPDVSDTSPYTGNDYDDQRLFCSNGVMSSHNLQAGWNKIWFTQRAPATYGLFNYSTNFGIVTTNETSAIDIQIRNIKGEIISAGLEVKPTPWVPNPADAAYTVLGFNDGIEYDVSGYGHNADIINSPTCTADTPRYQTAIHMTATNQKLHVSNLVTSGFGNTYSIAWWGKSNAYSGTMHWGFSDGIRLNGIYNGNLWNTGDGSNNPLYKPGTTTQVTAPTVNVWHHFVMVGDGSTCKAYMDGELWGQAKTYKAISGTSIYFNGWDSSTSYCQSDLNVSDFRIYATALSADDIIELYHTSASLADNGTLMAYQFNET